MQEEQEKHPHQPRRELIEGTVLAGSDGLIENLSAISALNGVQSLQNVTILISGFAFALAGAISMFFSMYISRKSEIESIMIDVQRERMEIETEPEEEKKELRELLSKEGYSSNEVDVIMERLQKDKEMWLRAQLRHELHIHLDELSSSIIKRALSSCISFFLFALVPLIPYIINVGRLESLLISIVLSFFSLFFLGSTRLSSLEKMSIRRGLETASLGIFAAVLLYFVGRLVSAYL